MGSGVARQPENSRKPRRPRGFGEAQTPFDLGSTGLAPLFAAYDYRCAFTGDDLTAEIKADPQVALLRLRGASNAPGAVIPASLEAIYAYERGHLALGQRHEFIVALDRIDPELLEALAPTGRLRLPDRTMFYPDPELLRAHRLAVAEGHFR
jgi:hypothetical protein